MYAVNHTSNLQMINVEQAHRRAHSEQIRQLTTANGLSPRARVTRVALRHKLAVAGATAVLMLGMVATAFATGGGSPTASAADSGSGQACVQLGRVTVC